MDYHFSSRLFIVRLVVSSTTGRGQSILLLKQPRLPGDQSGILTFVFILRRLSHFGFFLEF